MRFSTFLYVFLLFYHHFPPAKQLVFLGKTTCFLRQINSFSRRKRMAFRDRISGNDMPTVRWVGESSAICGARHKKSAPASRLEHKKLKNTCIDYE